MNTSNNNSTQEVQIDEKQLECFEKIKNNPQKNYFIQGEAGTGKSTLIKYLNNHLNRVLTVVSPTGIAAELIGGSTIHSLFKLGGRPYFPLNITEKYKNYDEILEQVETLIIDEASMLRADLLDTMNILCQKAKNNNTVFGGIQIILVGDLHQLPAVYTYEETKTDNKHQKNEKKEARVYMKNTYNHLYPFFFDAKCYQSADFEILKLTKSYRQDDEILLKHLKNLTLNDSNKIQEAIEYFNTSVVSNGPDKNTPIVTARKKEAKSINDKNLKMLPGELKTYYADVEGEYYSIPDFKERERRKNKQQAPAVLELKKGAKVMFCKNDLSKPPLYVNGTMGIIRELGENEILVEINGKDKNYTVTVTQQVWSTEEYRKTEGSNKLTLVEIGKFTQFPLKLAYAITIHKSQGQTWDSIYIDLGREGAFSAGQVYVALSRVKTKKGISLKRKLTQADIIHNNRVSDFLKTGKRPPFDVTDIGVLPTNRDDSIDFWQPHFPAISEYNSNYAAKDTNRLHKNTFWATMYNSRLENDWYLMCSDKTNKIAKLFYIKAGLFNRDQFDIDWEVTRKSRLPDKTKQFEVCICDDENYTEDIYKQVDFSDCLYATADFNENTIIKKEYDEDENDY